MTDAATVYRVLSAFGTRLYLDADGRMRHGGVDQVANNVWATIKGDRLELFFYAPEHGTHAFSMRQPSGGGGDPSEVVFGVSQTFETVPARAAIALRSGGKYLCCEPSGRVVLNRDEAGGWEEITLAAADPAPLPGPVEASVIASAVLPEVIAPVQEPGAAEIPPAVQSAGQAAMEPAVTKPSPAFAQLAVPQPADAEDNPAPAVDNPSAAAPDDPLPPEPRTTGRTGVWRRLRRGRRGA